MTINAFIDAQAWEIAERARHAAENVLLEMGLQGDELVRAFPEPNPQTG